MSHWDEFDYVIINDDLDAAVAELEAVMAGEGPENRVGEPKLAQRVKNILV
jgi:guanylate kinase